MLGVCGAVVVRLLFVRTQDAHLTPNSFPLYPQSWGSWAGPLAASTVSLT